MARPNFQSFFTDPQNIIAAGVTLISACALIVSLHQTRIMTQQQELMFEKAKAEVWPHISLGVSKGHNRDGSIAHFVIGMGNEGVGPAIIKGVRVRYNGHTAAHWWDLFDQFEKPDSVETFISNSGMNNRIVKIDKEFAALDLNVNLPLAQIYFREAPKIKIEVLYESIYGDRWLYTYVFGEKGTTESVAKDFEIPTEEQFDS